MRTWRRVVMVVLALGGMLLLWRWWSMTSEKVARHAAGVDVPAEPGSEGDPGGTLSAGGGGGEPAAPKLDRAKADAMRARVRALLAQAAAEAGSPAEGGVRAQAKAAPSSSVALPFPAMPTIPDLDGGGTKVDPAYIQKRVRDDLFPLAKDCYTTALEKNPKLAGTLAVYFKVIGDRKVGGVVDEVKILGDTTLDDAAMEDCVRESMMSVTFDAPPEDGALTVVYPLVFSPDDPEGGADL
ncbi:MAG TPA: AgmX/PglI C-terminal domain-containing protein [Polyangiaceae bacterium]